MNLFLVPAIALLAAPLASADELNARAALQIAPVDSLIQSVECRYSAEFTLMGRDFPRVLAYSSVSGSNQWAPADLEIGALSAVEGYLVTVSPATIIALKNQCPAVDVKLLD